MVFIALLGQGVVTFTVPYEFEISLSVVGDDITLPWRLVSMKILVGNSLPGQEADEINS